MPQDVATGASYLALHVNFLKGQTMNLSIPINFAQLKTVIAQCDLNEKLELFGLLEKDTFPVRFKQFLNQVKSDALSLEEITAEVEVVRQANYHAR